jgi:hypothetical protein
LLSIEEWLSFQKTYIPPFPSVTEEISSGFTAFIRYLFFSRALKDLLKVLAEKKEQLKKELC